MSNDAVRHPAQIAEERFKQGFNCAQSVLAAFAQSLGLEEAAALNLGSPFGGGMARRGEVCGAVTGALMALGLASRAGAPADKERAYALAQTFLDRFEERRGALRCRDLLGYDIGLPDERQAARDKGLFENVCPALVREAAEIVTSMLAHLEP